MSALLIVGLGPGSPDLLTRAAENALEGAETICARSARHPVLESLTRRGHSITVVDSNASGDSTDRTSNLLARRILDQTHGDRAVVFAVPGDPITDDPVIPVIRELTRQTSVRVRIVAGVSLSTAAAGALGYDPASRGTQIIQPLSLENASREETNSPESSNGLFRGVYRQFDPTRPIFVGPFGASLHPAVAYRLLSGEFPDEHQLTIIRVRTDGGDPTMSVTTVGQIAWLDAEGDAVFVYAEPVERLADLRAFDTLRYIVARLRAPAGCPWDREQTFQSMKKHLIEETYEAVAALDKDDLTSLAEELGDVLLQVVMYAQFGREAGDFTLEDVLQTVNAKLIRRHPHVFGDVKVGSSTDVLKNWERIKGGERNSGVSSFGGVPDAAPALVRASAIISRAERYGFPASLTANSKPNLNLGELGDRLIALVSEARRDRLDPEEALRLATNRLCDAFDGVILEHRKRNVDFASLDPEERVRITREALSRQST